MPYQHYKDTIEWLASILSKDIGFEDLMSMVIVEVISDAFDKPIESVVADTMYALQGS